MAGVAVAALAGSFGVWSPPAQAAGGPAPFACTSTRGSFIPRSAVISHIGRVQMITVGTNSDGSMGTPPLTNTGKHMLAWYNRSARPGSGSGRVATDAHSWPDGSALGNQLYANLVKGDTIALSDGSGHRTCFTVTSRTQYSASRVPMSSVVNGSRSSQSMSIVVCSGQRLGPGNWSQRTVWIAQAIAPPAPKPPPPAPTPPPPPPSGGLLGGLLGHLV